MAPKKRNNVLPILCNGILVTVLIIFFLTTPFFLHSTVAAAPNGLRLKMIPRYSHLNLSQEERLRRIAELSNARALRLGSSSSSTTTVINSTAIDPDIIRPPVAKSLDSYYMVQVSIGTPVALFYLLLDTGSDLIWVQGDGCNPCFPVKGGNFRNGYSSTYWIVECDHPLCDPRICPRGFCEYLIEYEGGPRSAGIMSTDTFTFLSDNGAIEAIGNIIFGLGMQSEKMVFSYAEGENNMIGGVLGLNSQPRSLLSQMEPLYKGRFGYCLQSWNSDHGSHSFLRFGDDAPIIGQGRVIQTTALLKGPNIVHYYVTVVDLSVAGTRLNLDPNLFKRAPDGSGGFLVDSGFAISYIFQTAYVVMKASIIKYFLPHKLQLVDKSRLGYDLCYAYPHGFDDFPSITFHFDGADLVVERDGVFQLLENSFFCLMMRPNVQDRLNVLGAFQQTNIRFLYDVEASTLSFSPENCAGA